MILELLCALSLSPVGDTTTIADSTYEVDPIVVVGTREPTRLSRAVNSIITVTPTQMIDLPANNILNYLDGSNAAVSVSAVNAAGYGIGPTGQGKLLIRGLGFAPNRGSLVLIDGRPEIAGLFGHPLPDTYRRTGLYSAELLKGGASTLYGSNAMAGVLDLQSFHRPDLARYTSVDLSVGKWNTLEGAIRHSQKRGRIELAGWLDYIESDNHRKDNEYFNRSTGFRVQLDGVAGGDMFASGRYSSFDFADGGPDYSPARTAGDIQRSGLTVGYDYDDRRQAVRVRAYTSYGEHRFSDGFTSLDRNNGIDLMLKRRLELNGKKLIVTGGGSVSYLGGSANNGTPAITSGNFGETEYAGHLQGEYDLSNHISVTFGGRYIAQDRFDNHAVYQIGTVLTPSENSGHIKLSVASAYRNPSISEMELFPISNRDSLRPEEATFYEVGYFREFSHHFSIETAFFWREGENLIEVVPSPTPGPPQTVNGGSFSHSGWEMTFRLAARSLVLRPSFMHLNQDSYNSSVPVDKLVLSGSFKQDKWTFDFDARAVFETRSDTRRPGITSGHTTLDDYFVLNLSQTYRLTPELSAMLTIDNLLDTDYQIVDGYVMPGTTIRLRLSARLY